MSERCIYSIARAGSGIPSLVDLRGGWERWWIRRQVPSGFGTKPSGTDIKGEVGEVVFVCIILRW